MPITERNGQWRDAGPQQQNAVTVRRKEADELTAYEKLRLETKRSLSRAYPDGYTKGQAPDTKEVDRNQYNAICTGPASTPTVADWCANLKKKIAGQ